MRPAMPGVLKSVESIHKTLACDEVAVAHEFGTMAYEDPKMVAADGYEKGSRYMNGKPDANGNRTNGLYGGMPENQDILTLELESLVGLLPPEIEHITTGYIPLSTLIPRLVQETFNGLNDVIDEMTELEASPPSRDTQLNYATPQLNGAGASVSSQVNIQKKLRMLNFAQDRRAQFIKILVLSQWSRQVIPISKVIDLTCWLNQQKRLYKDAKWWMGELKRILGPAKTPDPDLKTALEALSLSKASWLPDLGYIPPDPLSPQQILQGLQKINTLLSIRMNLHEKVPPSLREFSISSGKVTFHVPDEFELELSIADEDPSSQLYFIDFRFAFSPAVAEIPGGRLRDEIEGRTNDLLKRDGLTACYDFLHDLVLTYKLTTLKNQALEMSKGLWSENLRVEAVHRSLVVQYWLNRPGGKHWIEIGIKRQKERTAAYGSRRQDGPHIALRWFRSGRLVTDTNIIVEVGTLSLQKTLKQVIAAHTTKLLQEMVVRLQDGFLYAERLLKLKHCGSKSEPSEAFLLAQFTTSKAIKIVQNPVTGKFSLLPASPLYNLAEQGLNGLPNPGVEAPLRIANLRCTVAQEEVETFARGLGWEKANSLDAGLETVRRHFPRDTSKFGFFRRSTWDSWLLAFTTSLSGDSWWIVELEKKKREVETGNSAEHPVQAASRAPKAVFKIPMDGFKSVITDASYSNLAQIEKIAVGMISKYIDAQKLVYERIRHQFRRRHANFPEAGSAVLLMRLNRKRSPAMITTHSHMNLPWINELVSLEFGGLDPMTNSAIHTALGRLKTPVSNVRSLTSSTDQTIAFHPKSGAFAFRLLSSVGESTIPQVLQRLSSIDRLIYFLNSIKSHQLSCHEVSLNHVEFIYASTPSPLKAKLYFPADAPQRISLERQNPHVRIQDYISSIIRSPDGLSHAIRLLTSTLPLLRALARIEASHPGEEVMVLPRSAEWYEVRYQSLKGCYDVIMRSRRDETMWMVKNRTVSNAEEKDGSMADGMKRLHSSTGEGWRGMRDGIVASVAGVEGLVEKIDEIYRNTGNEEDQAGTASLKRKRKAEDDITGND